MKIINLTPLQVRTFRRTIYTYYDEHGRTDLPWRLTDNPYHVLVSEIMLQQTQVPRVIDKYTQFIKLFPDFEALDRATLRSVLSAWSGLGYNRRAHYLKRIAGVVISKFDGSLPENVETLKSLPGIGPATACGVTAFAFGKAHPFIETNIRSVFIHFFFSRRKKVADGEILPFVSRTLDKRDPRKWYNALMDYGVMLKLTRDNPAKKSAHHVKQARFAGSNRQARGLILKALTRKRLSERELQEATGLSLAKIRSNLSKLEGEGMVRKLRGKILIA